MTPAALASVRGSDAGGASTNPNPNPNSNPNPNPHPSPHPHASPRVVRGRCWGPTG